MYEILITKKVAKYILGVILFFFLNNFFTTKIMRFFSFANWKMIKNKHCQLTIYLEFSLILKSSRHAIDMPSQQSNNARAVENEKKENRNKIKK